MTTYLGLVVGNGELHFFSDPFEADAKAQELGGVLLKLGPVAADYRTRQDVPLFSRSASGAEFTPPESRQDWHAHLLALMVRADQLLTVTRPFGTQERVKLRHLVHDVAEAATQSGIAGVRHQLDQVDAVLIDAGLAGPHGAHGVADLASQRDGALDHVAELETELAGLRQRQAEIVAWGEQVEADYAREMEPLRRLRDASQSVHRLDEDLFLVLGICGHWWQADCREQGDIQERWVVALDRAGDCPVCRRPLAVVLDSWDELYPGHPDDELPDHPFNEIQTVELPEGQTVVVGEDGTWTGQVRVPPYLPASAWRPDLADCHSAHPAQDVHHVGAHPLEIPAGAGSYLAAVQQLRGRPETAPNATESQDRHQGVGRATSVPAPSAPAVRGTPVGWFVNNPTRPPVDAEGYWVDRD